MANPQFSVQDVWQLLGERDFALLHASREIARLQAEVAALKAIEDKKPANDKKA